MLRTRSKAMLSVLRSVLAFTLGIALPYVLQRTDRRRWLTPAQRQRAWNTASWGAALYAFGPFSMLGWVWVTRQDVRRWWRASRPWAIAWIAVLLIAGTLLAMCMVGVILGIDLLIAFLTGAPE
jgi:hypothetical protein